MIAQKHRKKGTRLEYIYIYRRGEWEQALEHWKGEVDEEGVIKGGRLRLVEGEKEMDPALS